ncbi:MAG TPA: SMC-Scp complex subunit ScpB, partial [Actinomycetota bacterium]|nr:SMC-Scp complex subunit ScpB [Actinomycetota bacterium]
MTQSEMRRALEAVLFIADESIPSADLAVLFEVPTARIEEEMSALADDLEQSGRGVVLRQVAGGWRMSTHPDVSQYLERFVAEGRSGRISNAALETLAIVAYRQPVSRATIGEIRGVASEGVLKTLVARGVIEEVGRD